MDPHDMALDDCHACLEVGFKNIIASQSPCKPPQSDSRFVKRMEFPEVKLSSTASKFKVVSLYERSMVGHFIGIFLSPCSINI